MTGLLSTDLGRARLFLTLTAVECFGPAVRDVGEGHLLNPGWPGHARVHLVWLLGFMVLSGLVILWQLWGARVRGVRDVALVAAWEACILGGYWIAALGQDLYGGVLTVPGEHVRILGVEESVLGFSWFTLFWAVGVGVLVRAWRRGQAAPA